MIDVWTTAMTTKWSETRRLCRLLLIICLAGPTLAAAESVREDAFLASSWPRDLPLPPRTATTGHLDNGLRYAIEHRSTADNRDKATVVVLVKTGSLYETVEQAGYAHYIEHVLFRGSKGQSAKKVEKFFRRMGIPVTYHGQQGMTSFDRTVYSLPIPESPDEHVPTALAVLAARVGAPLFRQEYVEAERDIVLSEEQTRRQSPGAKERFEAFYGSEHPMVSAMPIGTRESLSSATRESLHAFYEKWYRPDRMLVVVVGDVDEERTEKYLRRHFGRLKNPDEDTPPRIRVGSPVGMQVEVIRDPKIKVRTIGLALYRDAKSAYTIQEMMPRLTASVGVSVLSKRLGDYRNSAGYVTSLSTGFGRRNLDFETDGLTVSVEDGYELTAFSEVIDVVTDVMEKGVTPEEFATARALVEKNFEQSEESQELVGSSVIANQWLNAMLEEEFPASTDTYNAVGRMLLNEMNRADVHQSLIDRLKVNRMALVLGIPENEKLAAEKSEFRKIVDDLLEISVESVAVSEAAQGEEIEDPLTLPDLEPGAIVSEKYYQGSGITHAVLSNGAQVLFKTDPEENTPVTISVRTPGGLSLLNGDYDPVRASLARTVIIASGMRGLRDSAIGDLFSLRRTSLSLSLTEGEHGFRMRTTADELDFAFRALHIAFTEINVDAEVYSSMLAKNRTSLNGYISTPQFRFNAEVQELINPGRRMNSINLRPELLDMAPPEWIESSVRRLMTHASDSWFIVSGPLQWEAVRPMILRYVTSLPAGEPNELNALRYSLASTSTEIRRNLNPDDRSIGRFYYLEQSPGFDDAQSYVRNAYANMLNEALFKEIREDRGLVYSISSRVSSPSYPQPHAELTIGYVADPGKVTEIESHIDRVVKQMAERIPRGALKPIKKMLSRSFTDALDKPGFMLGLTYQKLVQGKPVPDPDTYLGYIDSLTRDAVHDYARQVAEGMVVIKAEYRPDPTHVKTGAGTGQ